MAKNDNLSDFMTDIADAIRAKKNTSEPINAQDFSAEIASIKTGGDGQVVYWNIPKPSDEGVTEILVFAHLVRVIDNGELTVSASGVAMLEGVELLAFAADDSLKYWFGGQELSFSEVYPDEALIGWGFTKITREEFYNPNI